MPAHIRRLGDFDSSAIGLGCMNLSHAYGTPPDIETASKLLNQALDMGYTMFDTATLYGFGANETLVGQALKGKRDQYILASKGGMFKGESGKREISGRPEMLKKNCEDSLTRLQTDVIDLYYLHRWDKNVPIEESIGALGELVKEGKIKSIGLSEVSADTLSKAHNEHPITAVQTEYSLWTRNPEIAVLERCKTLGVNFVAFSPVARGYLTGKLTNIEGLASNDLRRNMPRFEADNYAKNLALLAQVEQVAKVENCTLAELALAWVLQQGDHVLAIPGTTNLTHMKENFGASKVTLSSDSLSKLDQIMTPSAIFGPRYNAVTQTEIDTEEF